MKQEQQLVMMRQYKETAQLKASVVCQYVSELIESAPDQKFLVFAHHHVLLDAVQEVSSLHGGPLRGLIQML